ncbi:MAG: hypothetical protein IJS45_07205 [Clostridia bacterium]|nr:hypothetical protein [Clostridia bacterium]
MQTAELEKETPITKERHIVHIINPVSGSGRKFKKTRRALSELGEDIYLTKRMSDCEDFVAELLAKDPYAHIVAHGGDGTMGEAVGGIMRANAGATALFTGVPSGNGNDFLRYAFEEKNEAGKEYPVDLICANGKYSVNVVNVGFDCTVVSEAEKIRKAPGIGNSFSYILGVVSALSKKDPFDTEVVLRGVRKGTGEVDEEVLSGKYLLAAIANGRYYGGGFKVAPHADCGDGFIDVILVHDISIPKFATLISDFRKGTHVSADGAVKKNFADIMTFRRCRGISFGGVQKICYDGEIIDGKTVDAKVIPSAVIYTPPKKEWLI